MALTWITEPPEFGVDKWYQREGGGEYNLAISEAVCEPVRDGALPPTAGANTPRYLLSTQGL